MKPSDNFLQNHQQTKEAIHTAIDELRAELRACAASIQTAMERSDRSLRRIKDAHDKQYQPLGKIIVGLQGEFQKRSYDATSRAHAAETALRLEKERGDCLQQQIEKLKAAQHGGGGNVKLTSAIKKLSKSPLAAKRLAAACHPDKLPSEFGQVAIELFRLIQNLREHCSEE